MSAVLPYVLLIVFGITWAGSYTLVKFAVLDGVSPLGLAVFGSLGSGLVLLAGMAVARRRIPVDRSHMRFYAISGAVGIAVPDVAVYWAARELPVGILTLMIATVPIMTYGLALMVSIERPTLVRALGLVAGFAAIGLIVLPDTSLPAPNLRVWIALGALSALGYALQNVYIARWGPPESDSIALTCGSMILGGLMLLGPALAQGAIPTMMPPWTATEGAIASIVMLNAIGFLFFVVLLRRSGPVFASQMSYVVTISGMILGAVFFAERPSHWILAATALLFAGIFLVRARSRVQSRR